MLIFTISVSAQEIRSFTATYSVAPDKIISPFQQQHTVQLSWNIQPEKNVQRFEIERSRDNEHYKRLRSISQTFSSNQPGQFNYTDNIVHPRGGIYYYRLKMISKGRAVKVTPAQVVRIKRPTTSHASFANAEAVRPLKTL